MTYQSPKGTFDLIPETDNEEERWKTSRFWTHAEEVMRKASLVYGYEELRTPIFEHTELFIRSVGEATDIISKEMYTFQDKAGRSLSLRPEGTASIMRACMEKRLYLQKGSHKYCYFGPMFRYERPQEGRFRQFHQFGVEALGYPSPLMDVESIDLLLTIYKNLGIKHFTLHLNSVGDKETRSRYRQELLNHLRPRAASLSKESQERLERNPFRILDSKERNDQMALKGAPSILELLSPNASLHFETVKKELEEIGIPFTLNPNLVRGLDYYNQTVFEVTSDALGAQNAIGGGGRYDGLLAALGGPDLPAVGFALGIERVIKTIVAQEGSLPQRPAPFVFLIGMGEKAKMLCFKLLTEFRHAGVFAEMDYGEKKLSSSLQLASSLNAKYAVVIGENELSTDQAMVKLMEERTQFSVPIPTLLTDLIQRARGKFS